MKDILWFEDKNGCREFLHPLAIEGFCIEGLLDFQFFQTGPDSFVMEVQTSLHADRAYIREEMGRQMGRILRENGLGYVSFSMEFVKQILYLEDGKILDECRFPGEDESGDCEREQAVSSWLSSLRWQGDTQ